MVPVVRYAVRLPLSPARLKFSVSRAVHRDLAQPLYVSCKASGHLASPTMSALLPYDDHRCPRLLMLACSSLGFGPRPTGIPSRHSLSHDSSTCRGRTYVKDARVPSPLLLFWVSLTLTERKRDMRYAIPPRLVDRKPSLTQFIPLRDYLVLELHSLSGSSQGTLSPLATLAR